VSSPAQAGASLADERARIATYYAQRGDAHLERRYSLFNPGHLFLVQGLERALLAALARHGFADLARRSILDVGCGDGSFLRRLVTYGADRARLAGVDLLPERVEAARQREPGIDLRCADASALPYPDHAFDLLFQMTVFSSILDERMLRAVAAEMARLVKPDGAIISYDFRVTRDRRNTRPVRARDLARLFPGFGLDVRRITLVPPLARLLAGRSWTACALLETIPLLRTHELVVLRKRGVRGQG
jgi:SAM-dependent methyltransferase